MVWLTARKSILLLCVDLLMMGDSVAIRPPRRHCPQNKKVLLELRGGDLGPIDGQVVAKSFSALAAGDAICCSLIPRTSMRWFGLYLPRDSLSNKYLHGMGASAATISISTYLALTGSPVAEALAYGFVARLVAMTFMILTDEEKKVGMKFPMFGIMWMVLVVTIYTLLTGTGDPILLTKIVSLVLGMHGLFLHLYPGVVLRTTAVAVGPDPLVKDILSMDGGYMLAAATTTFLLAQGYDPVKVVGFTAISSIPVMLKLFEIIEAQNLWGMTAGFGAVAAKILLACVIVGTLH